MMRLSSILCVAWCFAVACKPERQAAEAPPAASASASGSIVAKPVEATSGHARRHLPPGCDVALEVDLQKLFANERLGPQLLAGVVPPKDPQLREQVMAHPDQAAFLRLLEASKIDPRTDLKTVAFCIPESAGELDPRFLAIIAGRLPSGLVELMREHAPPGKTYTLESLGTEKALFREGKWMSQGEGNVVLFGNDKDLIVSAQKASRAHEHYALAKHADVAVAIKRKALASIEGPDGDPLVAALRRAEQAQLQVDLSSGELTGRVALPDAASVKQVQSAVEMLLSQMRAQSQQAPPEIRQMMQPTIDVLEKARLTPEGNLLRLALQLEPGMLEAALLQLAMASLQGGPVGPPVAVTPARVNSGAARSPALPPGASRCARTTSPNKKHLPPGSRGPAPMLPQLPSFQLTPPTALRSSDTALVPLPQAKTPAAARMPEPSVNPGGP